MDSLSSSLTHVITLRLLKPIREKVQNRVYAQVLSNQYCSYKLVMAGTTE